MNYAELIRAGIIAIKEIFTFVGENKGVDVKRELAEAEGLLFTLQCHAEKQSMELNDLKLTVINKDKKIIELQKELEGLTNLLEDR